MAVDLSVDETGYLLFDDNAIDLLYEVINCALRT
jgi:hypothetical protein